MHIPLPKQIREFADQFLQAGYQIFLVGGAVRSIALGSRPKDWDFATDALPTEVVSLFRKVIPTGQAHGTVTVLYGGQSFEVTTFRIDGTYTDMRRPDTVRFSTSIEQDLMRRDFTMNAMAVRFPSGDFLDPHGGRSDIAARTIRTVGNPAVRFSEDALRIMRGLRFASQLGFSIEPATLGAMEAAAGTLRGVSVERFRDEFLKLLAGKGCVDALLLGQRMGLFRPWIPELDRAAEFRGSEDGQNLLVHLGSTAVHLKETGDLALVLAGLFHDIEKPATYTVAEDGRVRFPRHDEFGAQTTEKILRRLKLPNRVIEDAKLLVRNHMYDHKISDNPRAIRRFISRVGGDMAKRLIALRQADILGKGKSADSLRVLHGFSFEVERILDQEKPPLTLGDLQIDGHIMMKELGIPGGRVIGSILNELLEAVLDDPSLNRPEHLKMLAKNIWHDRWEQFSPD